MRPSIGVLLLLALTAAGAAPAQRQRLGAVDSGTPEGQLLRQIGSESDETRKFALLDEFATKFPQHDAIKWVYAETIALGAKAGQPAKAVAAGEKLLALDPEDIYSAVTALKAAEAVSDPDLVLKWAARTSEIARKATAAPKPANEGEVEQWKNDVDYAQQVEVYTEYAIYAAALKQADPRKKVELAEALRARNPDSRYLPQLATPWFNALRQLNENEKAVQVAEMALEKDQSNEDMLLVVANSYIDRRKEPEKALAYSARLVEIMTSKPKPEGVADADWAKRKNLMVGLGHWMQGVTYTNTSKWADAEAALKRAMPLIQADPQLRASALFHLGLATFKQGKTVEARKLFEQCAAIDGPFRKQAQANLKAIPR